MIMKSKYLLYYLLVLTSFLYIGISITLLNLETQTEWGDTYIYRDVAMQPLTSQAMWANGNVPAGLPLFYKLLGNQDRRIIIAQFGVSVLAWLALAWALALNLKPSALQGIAFVATLLMSWSTNLFIWQTVLLTESLSNSALVLVVAGGFGLTALYRAGIRPRWKAQLGLGLGFLILIWWWSSIRYANAYPVVAISGVLLVLVLWKRRRLQAHWPLLATLIIGCIMVYFSFSFGGSSTSESSMMYSVIARRILPDADARQFFVEEGGMPMNDDIMAFSGQTAPWERPWPPEMNDWLTQQGGLSIYLQYLIQEMPASLIEPLENWSSIYAPNLMVWSRYQFVPTALQNFAMTTTYSPNGFWLIALLLVIVLGNGLWISRMAWDDPRWLIPFITLATLIPLTLMIYYISTSLARHAVGLALQLRLGLLILFLLGLETLWQRYQESKESRPRAWYGLGMVLVVLIVLDQGVRLENLRRHWILPTVTNLSSTNWVGFWGVNDLEYKLVEAGITDLVEEDSVIVTSFEADQNRSTLVYMDTWQFVPERYADTTTTATALVQWREVGLASYITKIGIHYAYLEAGWVQQQSDFFQQSLSNQYTILFNQAGWTLYQASAIAPTDAALESQLGMSAETYAEYQQYLQDHDPLIPADAAIFAPMSQLDWFESASELGRFIETGSFDSAQRANLFQLLSVWDQLVFAESLPADTSPAAYEQWRATKSPADLQAMGFDYLFINDLWESYLTVEESNTLNNPQNYQRLAQWQDDIPGIHKLLIVINP